MKLLDDFLVSAHLVFTALLLFTSLVVLGDNISNAGPITRVKIERPSWPPHDSRPATTDVWP